MQAIERQGKDLEYLMVYPDEYDGQKAYPIIILLHGYGASMYDLSSLAPAIDRQSYIYACPNGPITVDFGDGQYGYSWRPPRGSDLEETGVGPTIEGMLEGFCEGVMAEHRVAQTKAILLGFSQGGSMTYRLGLRRPDLFAGLIALSCSLSDDVKHSLSAQTTRLPIFIGHGIYDNIERAQQARSSLEDLGYPLAYHEYPIGHEITQHVLDDLIPWVHNVLAPLA
jgi:phospholipase/carboxylesterase